MSAMNGTGGRLSADGSVAPSRGRGSAGGYGYGGESYAGGYGAGGYGSASYGAGSNGSYGAGGYGNVSYGADGGGRVYGAGGYRADSRGGESYAAGNYGSASYGADGYSGSYRSDVYGADGYDGGSYGADGGGRGYGAGGYRADGGWESYGTGNYGSAGHGSGNRAAAAYSTASRGGGNYAAGSRGSGNYGGGSRGNGNYSTGSRSAGGSGSRNTGTSAGRGQTGYGYGGSGSSGGSRSKKSRRRKQSPDYRIIAILGVILILVIAAVLFFLTQRPGRSSARESIAESETTAPPETETELQKEVMVDGITITGMSRDEAKAAILKNYPWKMTAVYNGDVYELTNLMSDKVDALLEEVFTGVPRERYTLDTSGLDDAVAGQVAAMKERWNKPAKNGSISGYDAASDSFTFSDGESGVAVDEAKLTSDIQAAIKAKDFDVQLQVNAAAVEPEISKATAQGLYKTIGTYTTNTTANSKRNTNVRLAAEQLNGTIVQPGAELSFNDTVGERTEAKGYQSAAAYSNGEVVQEIGGGVCQVSTTLYNAVVRAGLQISRRQSHTFEPSYVTPGMDATVSWGGPDFKFVNNSEMPIGIKANYHDQTMTVSVYGVPILEEGVTYSLESKKLQDLDPPAPTYQEDQTVPLDQEVTVSAGSNGSRWETRLVIKKNGEVISNEVDHTTSYKGHAAVIKRNTSGVWIPPESESGESQTESAANGESVPAGPGDVGPGSYPGGSQPSPDAGTTGAVNGPGGGSNMSGGPGGGQTVPSGLSQPSGGGAAPSPGPGGGENVVPPPFSP